MSKRITYLLVALLLAESAVPLSAHSLGGQTRTYSAINTNYVQTTTGGGIIVNPPTTTGPAITVKLDKIYATEIADARAKIDFQLHNVALKPEYTNQAASLHIALDSNMALSSVTSTGEATNELVDTPGVVAIYDSKHFTFEFTAKNINPDSIKGNSYFTFKIPGWLLTHEVDLEAKVFIEHDTVSQPILSVDSTASSGAKMVTLACDTKYSRIRYTLDGSDVTLGSPLYDGTPITLTSSDTLKATAFVGTMPSEQIQATYDNLASDENNDSSVETDSPTEDSDQTTSDITNPSTDSNSLPDTVSNAVTTLIEQKERNLTTKVTEAEYGLTINNQKVELENKLLVSNGRTLAPLRTIAKVLNIPIHYHAKSKTAIIKTEDKLIEFPLGYNVAIVTGEMIQIDAKDPTVLSTIQDGKTYLPVRFIAEQLNLNIHFDGEQVHMNSVK